MVRGQSPFSALYDAFSSGSIDRREFLKRATALGMGASVALYCADAVAQSATPGASPAASPAAAAGKAPDSRTDGQERGAGGELKLLQWQAPTHMNGLAATGDKDGLASSLVCEALLSTLPDATNIPQLAEVVPSLDNGMLSDDLLKVTYKLREGVVWSDGTPLTSEDIKFTVEWAKDGANGAILKAEYDKIKEVEIVDELTATLHFSKPNPQWSITMSGNGAQHLLPKHILGTGDKAASDAFRSKPIGTGPYVVDSFTPNDQVTYSINDKYREPNKPFFNKVVLKGGGDAAASARATLQTGEYDYGWNLAVETQTLKKMDKPENPGALVIYGGMTMERVNFNFSDPNKEVNGEKSEVNTPHPILSDLKVRQAIVLGTNREKMASSFYFGPPDEPAVANALTGLNNFESTSTSTKFDPEGAKALLDEAGWKMDGNVRKKDGMELKLVHYTTTSALRQKIQAAFKANMEDIGIKIELKAIDSAVFFDSSAGNDQNSSHLFQDMNEYAAAAGSPPPVTYMLRWYGGPELRNIAQKSNEWSGRNISRWHDDEYDKMWEEASTEADMTKAAALFIKMNDMLYDNAVVMPLVRYGSKSGVNKRMNMDNLGLSNFEFSYWNIANWNLAEGGEVR